MKNRQPANLPPVAEYLRTLDTTSEFSQQLLTIKAPTIKIPPAIRQQMKSLLRLNQFWATNRTTYTALVEAAGQLQGEGKSKTAGA